MLGSSEAGLSSHHIKERKNIKLEIMIYFLGVNFRKVFLSSLLRYTLGIIYSLWIFFIWLCLMGLHSKFRIKLLECFMEISALWMKWRKSFLKCAVIFGLSRSFLFVLWRELLVMVSNFFIQRTWITLKTKNHKQLKISIHKT